MKVWELLPIDPTSEHWSASTVNGRIVVRAATGDRAREIAVSALGIATQVIPGTEPKFTPWGYQDLTECRELTDGSFDVDGDEAILDPSEHDREWR